MYQFSSAGSSIPVRITKGPVNKAMDVSAPKCAPLYLQIDGPEENIVRLSLNALHPRILLNSGAPIVDYIEPAYLFLETFKWFNDCEIPMAKAYLQTRGCETVEISFEPGRHICRQVLYSVIELRSEISLFSTPVLHFLTWVGFGLIRYVPNMLYNNN
jgi:hypothetical protein